MTTKFSNTYLTSMKVTSNPHKKVIHYLRKKRFGSAESRDNRKRGNGDSKRIKKTKTCQGFWCKEEQRKRVVAQGQYGLGLGALLYLFTVREKCQHVCVLIGITSWEQTKKTDDAGSLEVMTLNI